VKALELCKRGEAVRDPKPDFLVKALLVSEQNIGPISRREEYSTAAQTLTSAIEKMLAQSSHETKAFDAHTTPAIQNRIDALRDKAAEELTRVTRETADEADRFAGELTTQQTLAVKQVNDAIDGLYRNRRRRLRLVRKIGFGLLEWMLLGLMWCIWFAVVVLRVVRGAVLGVVRGARWLLWL